MKSHSRDEVSIMDRPYERIRLLILERPYKSVSMQTQATSRDRQLTVVPEKSLPMLGFRISSQPQFKW